VRALPRASLILVGMAACLPPIARPADNVIDARYRLAAATTATTTATSIYRWVGERSLAVPSRCKMLPTDSQAFAIRAQHCGGATTWYWSVARLFLEQAGSEQFTPALRMDGRRRWIDLPGPCE
jgi:hypothetical protein